MTNGGLVAIRSKRSPATGSKKEPSRTSIPPAVRVAGLHDGEVVEGGVEPGQPERPLVDVGGDHPAGVGGEVQRLDPAAGAEVERPVDRLADGQLGQGERGGADAEDVVGSDAGLAAVEPGRQVGGHPEVPVASGVGGGVRADVEPRGHLAHARGEEAHRPPAGPPGPAGRPRPPRGVPAPGAGRAGSASPAVSRPSYDAGRASSRCDPGPRGPAARAARPRRRR